ncbi:hypothetical protein DAETH_23940 [Deinococcus aetherius]|uniref:Uncharacterized protein n=1 Tax=Deinococcus aetherius TaxID=200252 RepID=A0ABN6RGE3_9DEIO|nr:hypothetical protein DAETH_23940 [Deinococcus aetherius]
MESGFGWREGRGNLPWFAPTSQPPPPKGGNVSAARGSPRVDAKLAHVSLL